jgi:cell division protein FtsI (penicillin-binding protein 3)
MKKTVSVQQKRIVVGALVCAMAFALVEVRLIDVTILKGASGAPSEMPLETQSRSDLVDRQGMLLARDLPTADLYARPHNFADKGDAARTLADTTGADARRVGAAFEGKRDFVLVARQIDQATEARVMRLGLKGLEFEPSMKRFYPGGRAAAQVLGVTDPDNNGVSGLERGLNGDLTRDGQTDAVETSLDMRVQYVLAREMGEARGDFGALAAGGVVMDVNTGEILGLVSLPDFDPNTRALGKGDSERNIMVQDVYELGSVFKIVSFALALEDHTIRNLDEVLPIGNGYKIGKFTIHEAEHMPATLKVRDILAQSSNIGAAQIALRSGAARQRAFLTRMGLLSPLATELPERARPLYPSNWGEVETATIGFGHGISVSPLAYATAAAAIVNGGRRIVPTFLKHPADTRGEQLVRSDTSATMRDLLRYVVTDGTGKSADVPGYDVGGKTGSAEKVAGRGYQAHKLVTSFCAAFPIEAPRYLVFVMLDEPHGNKSTSGFALAAYTAAPAAGRIISRIAPMLGVAMHAPEGRGNS